MPRILRMALQRWLRFAELLGNLQMTLLLSLVYVLLLAPLAVPFRFLADPLALRGPGHVRWVHRSPTAHILQDMRKQG